MERNSTLNHSEPGRHAGRRFAPGWKLTLFVLVFLPLLIGLGTWQLQRASGKRALMAGYLASAAALPKSPEADLGAFERLRLKGQFGHEIFLVDNQVRDGRVGYWVIQSFAADSQRYLVNRGFVPAPTDRQQLPEIDTPPGAVSLVGMVWPFTGLIPVLDDDAWSAQWPKRVQRLDIDRMAEHAAALPTEIRLEPGQAGVFAAAPFVTVLGDDKHNGYAATWFGLAVVLMVGYCIVGWRRRVD